MAVIGVAAFSAGSAPDETAPEPTAADTEPVSARVASAVFAVSVTPEAPEAVTAATPPPSNDAAEEPEDSADVLAAAEPTETTEAPPGTTTSEATTTTTKAPVDTTPPSLEVTSPENGATVDDRFVTFRGSTERGARVASGPYEAEVDDDGAWTLQLVVSPGANGAAFTATDKAGNSTTVRIVVHYDAPEEAPPATTTTAGSGGGATTTTTSAPASQWSPLWPADAGGIRNVETWRPLVEKYWDADKVDCALGLIKIESRGDPRAYNSSTGAEGLFQHLRKYWKGRAAGAGFVDGNGLYATPYNGEANIAAAAYLANYYEEVGKNWWQPWGIVPNYGSCGSGG